MLPPAHAFQLADPDVAAVGGADVVSIASGPLLLLYAAPNGTPNVSKRLGPSVADVTRAVAGRFIADFLNRRVWRKSEPERYPHSYG